MQLQSGRPQHGLGMEDFDREGGKEGPSETYTKDLSGSPPVKKVRDTYIFQFIIPVRVLE